MKEIIRLHFYGYTWEEYVSQISNLKGIFVVYRGGLTGDGDIHLKEILYLGYHIGVLDLYNQKIIEQLKGYISPSDRLFFSYAEVPSDIDYKILESILYDAVSPKYERCFEICLKNIHLVCEGNCGLFPQEITN